MKKVNVIFKANLKPIDNWDLNDKMKFRNSLFHLINNKIYSNTNNVYIWMYVKLHNKNKKQCSYAGPKIKLNRSFKIE